MATAAGLRRRRCLNAPAEFIADTISNVVTQATSYALVGTHLSAPHLTLPHPTCGQFRARHANRDTDNTVSGN
jgi:hypothetical protein